jgi:hypothetical protein
VNEWLYEEAAALDKAKEDERVAERKLQLRQQWTGRLWNDLKPLLADAATQINHKEEFANVRQKIGKLDCAAGYSDRIEITKSMYPAIYLVVTIGPLCIEIRRKIVTNGHDRRSRDQKEVLNVEIDQNGNGYLVNQDGTTLPLDKAVQYIFRPFIYPELLGDSGESGNVSVMGRILG